MLLIIGTVPLPEGIYQGNASFDGDNLNIDGVAVPIERGTAALAAAALRVMEHFGEEKPYCLLAGDRSSGTGSQRLLNDAVRFLPSSHARTVVFHYMFVLLKYGPLLKEAFGQMSPKPFLIADAGGMYLAKASGVARNFDLFTPDRGELAFLADAEAAHPMYTKPHFFQAESPVLAHETWKCGNSPRFLAVKGSTDYVIEKGTILKSVSQPSIRSMEAMGGTGDTVTGIIAALQYFGVNDYIYKAFLLNRLTGEKNLCTPRTQIKEFINNMDLSLLHNAGVEL